MPITITEVQMYFLKVLIIILGLNISNVLADDGSTDANTDVTDPVAAVTEVLEISSSVEGKHEIIGLDANSTQPLAEQQGSLKGPAKQVIDKAAEGRVAKMPAGKSVSSFESVNNVATKYKGLYNRYIENGGAPPLLPGQKPGFLSSKSTQSGLQLASAVVDVWVDSGVGYNVFSSDSGHKLFDATKEAAYKSFGDHKNFVKSVSGMVQSYAPTPLGLASATGKTVNYIAVDLKELGEASKLALSNYLGSMLADAMDAANAEGIKDKEKFDEFVTNYMNSHVNIIYKNFLLAISVKGTQLSIIADDLKVAGDFLKDVGNVVSNVVGKAFDGYTLIGRGIASLIPDNSQQLGLMSAVDKRVYNFLASRDVEPNSPVGRAVKSFTRVKAQELDLPLSDDTTANVIANDMALEKTLKMMQEKEKIGLMRKAQREAAGE